MTMTAKRASTPFAHTSMLIRKPAAEVFNAFIDPAITSKFWFTGGDRKLEAGKRANWEWRMYGFSIPVDVKAIEPNRRIEIEWPGYSGQTTVEWQFKARPDNTTYVDITERGFAGTPEELAKQVGDSTQGFTFVLAGLKAWLEHGVELNLVRDAHPDGLPAS
jgi:uncharacterized protein YndB with AHSA1/START domain